MSSKTLLLKIAKLNEENDELYFKYNHLKEKYNELKNKTLKDLEIRNRSGANIIGYKTATGEYIVNPSADTRIIPQSKLFVLGTPEQITALKIILS